MTKTAAEYQKAYRERKKLKDKTFLEKERARAKGYRKKTHTLAEKDQKFVRERNRFYSKKYRDRKNALSKKNKVGSTQITVESQEQFNEVLSTSSSVRSIDPPETQTRANRGQSPLFVKLSFPGKKRNKRNSDVLKRAHSRIQSLTGKVASLKRTKDKWVKRFQRLSNKTKVDTESERGTRERPNESPPTPSSKTKLELRQDGVSPRKLPKKVVKKLVLSNAILDEIKVSRKENPEQRKRNIAARIVSGKIIRRYKCLSILSKKTGIGMRELNRENEKAIEFKKRSRMNPVREQLKAQVVSFIEQDDVSIMMPGKGDAKLCDGEKRQVRILTDYMANIHQRFKAEYQKKISLALFCKLRPEYVKLTSSMSRNTCLCSRHQNIAMKLKCMRSLGIDISKNPETVSKTVTEDNMAVYLCNIKDNEVEYETWRRVEVEGKRKMRIVKVKCNRDEFIDLMKDEYQLFLSHVGRVKSQYAALKAIKEGLPKNDLIVQMDFAENFTCGTSEEIQSAYWNASSVTLHPVVCYYRDETDSLQHINYIFVSDVSHHNSAAVLTILKKLTAELRENFPRATQIHYWTDSPSSQYRNRFIFDAIIHHADKFNAFCARWNYFESGHGKGPCDGLGGVAKRKAGDAIKQGKACIQDASDFYNWALTNPGSIKYRFYSSDEYCQTSEEVQKTTPPTLPGSMKTHSVLPWNGGLYSRNVSCYCHNCMTGENLCDGWTWHKMPRKVTNASSESHTKDEVEQRTETSNVKDDCANNEYVPIKGDYVSAIYEEEWYIGRVVEVDQVDADVNISFMKRVRSHFSIAKYKWPHPADELWVDFDQIICSVKSPEPIGKSGREFKFAEDDFIRTQRLFEKMTEKHQIR